MYTKLSIPERLKDLRVVDKHLTLEQLAEQTGLSKSALGKYESDDYKDISPFAIATLAKFYGVSTDYLMGVSENKNHPNTELQALHLSDAMVELLSSGKINNRLLCELATHPNFLRLMVDMEIFIDQIADMRVNQMNLILEATRQTILKEHAPGENDLYMRTLELGQVQENDFYSHILHDDLDSIVRDIREGYLSVGLLQRQLPPDQDLCSPAPGLCQGTFHEYPGTLAGAFVDRRPYHKTCGGTGDGAAVKGGLDYTSKSAPCLSLPSSASFLFLSFKVPNSFRQQIT